ncbi:carboxylesterase/lipase family protein [Actinomadura decatromicini]|uniref:Carboxylic ester hydrolase n=1 Tax=Actinomadura decatromicini TaxID=2604572 RepID=A0A5D3F7P4_9ACTN|nr:carboxylesterase family protein [Actinomadura decatromicini]TYK44152.1 carboxylesterase family protein [Actinomadura decatromicini]
MEPKKLRWPIVIAAAAAATMFTSPVSAAPVAPSTTLSETTDCASGTTVSTDKGSVCGTVSDGVASWLGIRYAAPPVGRLRWAPPEPAPAWTSTFPATEKGNNCPQADGLGAGSTNEDCLNLNVRAPVNAGAKRLPVMVQIHGGGFRFGTPADGSHLVRSGNVISVEVHYRLGIFGFMAHKDLGRHSGNYAFQDQQAALRWVQRNIANFGGDPHNVTIYGASAGGSSVCANAVSPTAKGLFQKGIAQSGEYNSLLGTNTSWQPQDCKSELPTAEQAHRTGDRFAAAVGCGNAADTAACLRQVPVKTLLDKSGDGMGPDQGTMAPIVDGKTLTMSPAKAFVTGHINKVTLMHGVDRDETQLASANTPADYSRLVQQQYGRYASKVFALYPLDRFPAPAAFIAYRTIAADSNSVCPSLLNHQRMSRYITVYGYQSDNSDAPPASFLDQTKPNGAFHVLLNQFLSPRPGQQFTPNQQAFGAQITAQWTGFARTGDPTVPGAPLWPRFTRQNPDVMSLAPAGDSELTREIARQHHCDFWNKLTPYNH